MTQVEEQVAQAPPATPMVRHIVEKKPGAAPTAVDYEDKALCGALWDRLFVSPDGPLCGDCRAEFRLRTGR